MITLEILASIIFVLVVSQISTWWLLLSKSKKEVIRDVSKLSSRKLHGSPRKSV